MPLDDRIKQLTDTILQEVRSPIETALQSVLAEVMKLAADDRDEAVRAALATAAEEHQASTSALRAEAESSRAEAESSRVDVDALRGQFERELEASLAALRDQLDHQREAAVAAVWDEATALHQSHLEAQEMRLSAEHDAVVQGVRDDLGRRHEQALEDARADAAQVRQTADAAEQAREQAEQAARETAAAAEQAVSATHAAAREQEMACTDRMLTAFRQLDGCRSLTEILNALADHAATETGRAAVLVVAGSRLHGWAMRGLPDADPAAIDVPIEPSTVFGLAVAQGVPISTSDAPIGADGNPLSTLLAAPAGRAGLAVPISVGGRIVAILYADDAGDRTPVVPSTWPELTEILASHAGRCLEVLTMSRAQAASEGARPHNEGAGARPIEAAPPADDSNLLGNT
jgi:chemotaxis protein histidine kinase CheA